jgi:predicted RNA-binding Zn-ribbon protein involved in translation (DUF1610 family)
MNQDPSQLFALRWQAFKPWITTILIIWFLGFVGLGWLVKSFLFFIGFMTIAPMIAFIGLRWWLGRNLIQAACPVCQYGLTALNQSQIQCPNCGERLSVENRQFQRISAPGTIDIEAVEVAAQVVDDEP